MNPKKIVDVALEAVNGGAACPPNTHVTVSPWLGQNCEWNTEVAGSQYENFVSAFGGNPYGEGTSAYQDSYYSSPYGAEQDFSRDAQESFDTQGSFEAQGFEGEWE